MNCDGGVTHLDVKGVTHSGIIDIGYGPTVVFRDPDNMQLEFYVHQGVDEMQLDAPIPRKRGASCSRPSQQPITTEADRADSVIRQAEPLEERVLLCNFSGRSRVQGRNYALCAQGKTRNPHGGALSRTSHSSYRRANRCPIHRPSPAVPAPSGRVHECECIPERAANADTWTR